MSPCGAPHSPPNLPKLDSSLATAQDQARVAKRLRKPCAFLHGGENVVSCEGG